MLNWAETTQKSKIFENFFTVSKQLREIKLIQFTMTPIVNDELFGVPQH